MVTAFEKLEIIIDYMINPEAGNTPTGVDAISQFRPDKENDDKRMASINAAFLILLCGREHPSFEQADEYLKAQTGASIAPVVVFLRATIGFIQDEIEQVYKTDTVFASALTTLSSELSASHTSGGIEDAVLKIQKLFFPEGSIDMSEIGREINELREKRKITITSLNSEPIQDPAREVLFTANALITIPTPGKNIKDSGLTPDILEALKKIVNEDQRFWYDHPIPIGIPPEENEVVYGLKGLSQACAFEREYADSRQEPDRMTCVLSVSTTHTGLQGIARRYLEGELRKGGAPAGIDLYAFTERDTRRLVDEVLVPAAQNFCGGGAVEALHEIFGVDGKYGRHYSFLKAIAAFWKVCVSEDVRATFKIDLDQVFPEEDLVRKTGKSAFEHLKTPLWGAAGTDSYGSVVELGMIAGALVNERDAVSSIYTPDVNFPEGPPPADEIIFRSIVPQALSTRAEMMTRYDESTAIDGTASCIQRIHVTGGTTGILIDSLQKYRPFSPTFIGRAEDQSYLLSVLFENRGGANLRYLHADGLIMRHDKEAFAGEAIKSAKTGKLIGDYIRILLFTAYADALPWSADSIKEEVDPFTGCFISRIPLTVVMLRFAFRAFRFFQDGDQREAVEFFSTGCLRLSETIDEILSEKDFFKERYHYEKRGWGLYYDTLAALEKGIEEGDSLALELKAKAEKVVKDTRLEL